MKEVLDDAVALRSRAAFSPAWIVIGDFELPELFQAMRMLRPWSERYVVLVAVILICEYDDGDPLSLNRKESLMISPGCVIGVADTLAIVAPPLRAALDEVKDRDEMR
jgi:hypothetical protein